MGPGHLIAELQESNPTFNEHGPLIATISADQKMTLIYDRSGDRRFALQDDFSGFSPDG